ncbi:MAG TPA: hypothetical protein VFG72_12670 [Marmoricola sp.]|nr:hypothetical protein [Marmoricola sp.]
MAGELDGEQGDRQRRILEAVIDLLARDGISGVSMRAVAREAGRGPRAREPPLRGQDESHPGCTAPHRSGRAACRDVLLTAVVATTHPRTSS